MLTLGNTSLTIVSKPWTAWVRATRGPVQPAQPSSADCAEPQARRRTSPLRSSALKDRWLPTPTEYWDARRVPLLGQPRSSATRGRVRDHRDGPPNPRSAHHRHRRASPATRPCRGVVPVARTLLDELNTPACHARSQAKVLERIWHITERPARAGLSKWRPYEDLPWTVQQATLEAAAVAIHLFEEGDIKAKGTLGSLFLVEPHHVIPDGAPPVRNPEPHHLIPDRHPPAWTAEPIDYGECGRDDFNIAVKLARHDPDAARQLFRLSTYRCRSPACFERGADMLREVGIPASFLSHYPELGRSCRPTSCPRSANTSAPITRPR